MENREKKRIKVATPPKGLTNNDHLVPANKATEVVVLTPKGTAVAQNLIEIAYIETARILIKSREGKMTPDDRKMYQMFSETIVAFSREEREARKVKDLENMTDEELFAMIEEMQKKERKNEK